MGNTSEPAMDVDDQLIAAAKEGNSSQINQLIADGADVNCHDNQSNTPLMWASGMGHLRAFESLIHCKARLEERDNDGYTALHWAVAQKKYDIVKKLIEFNADINALNKDGDTPLHRASHYDNKDIANLLIINGAKLNIQNKQYQTPFDKSRTLTFKHWFYTKGARPNSTKYQIPSINENENISQNNNNNSNNDEKKQSNNNSSKKEMMKREVKEWLQLLTLIEYYDKFIINGYDRFESCIYDITKDELKEIGVKMGHIKIILNSINERKSNQLIYNEVNEQPGQSQSLVKSADPIANPNYCQNDDGNEQEGEDVTKGGLIMGQVEAAN